MNLNLFFSLLFAAACFVVVHVVPVWLDRQRWGSAADQARRRELRARRRGKVL